MERKKKEKNTIIKGFILGALTMLAVYCLYHALLLFFAAADTPSSSATTEKIRQMENTIDANYLGEIDKQVMTDYMFLGMVAGLGDKYSTYYTKEEYEEVTSVQSGYFEGVGIVINMDEDGRLVISSLIEDAPAERAGILPGDILVSINGIDLTGFTTEEAVEMIQGDEDGVIDLSVLRGKEQLDFTLTMEKVLRNPVTSELLEDDIGLIKINTFDNMTAEEFKNELDSLKEEEIKGLIIDLRGNRGGLVSAACDTMREFMPEGLLVYTEDKHGAREEHSCDGKNELDLPIVLLVNSETASSAEIFSGAVKDYEKGTLVGVQTFGKGIVQNPYKFADGSVVKLTIAHYYTPKGNDIHGKGITPDIIVEDEEEQLTQAIEVLKEEM